MQNIVTVYFPRPTDSHALQSVFLVSSRRRPSGVPSTGRELHKLLGKHFPSAPLHSVEEAGTMLSKEKIVSFCEILFRLTGSLGAGARGTEHIVNPI